MERIDCEKKMSLSLFKMGSWLGLPNLNQLNVPELAIESPFWNGLLALSDFVSLMEKGDLQSVSADSEGHERLTASLPLQEVKNFFLCLEQKDESLSELSLIILKRLIAWEKGKGSLYIGFEFSKLDEDC